MPTPALALAAALRAVFPPSCATACQAVASETSLDVLPPCERRAVERAVSKRRNEFIAGREAARHAFRQLTREAVAIPMRPDRAPDWPDGFTGSISHADGWAVAVVAPVEVHRAVGVDIESSGVVKTHLWPHVLRPQELARLEHTSCFDAEQRATIAFCAEEAFFKLQYTATQRWIDFTDVEVDIDPRHGRFVVHPCRSISVFGRGEFEGAYHFAGAVVVAGLSIS